MVQGDPARYAAPCCCNAEHLTEREIEVLKLIAAGRTNREVAELLYLSTHTVNRHVTEMLRRTRTRNRASMVAAAYSAGILLPSAHWPRLSGRRCLVRVANA